VGTIFLGGAAGIATNGGGYLGLRVIRILRKKEGKLTIEGSKLQPFKLHGEGRRRRQNREGGLSVGGRIRRSIERINTVIGNRGR